MPNTPNSPNEADGPNWTSGADQPPVTRWRDLRFGKFSALLAALLVTLIGTAWGEIAGWTFLAMPLERRLADALERRVVLSAGASPATSRSSAEPSNSAGHDRPEPGAADRSPSASDASGRSTSAFRVPGFRLRFIGGFLVQTTHLEIAAPEWSDAPFLLSARDVTLRMRYSDLWRAWRGEPVRIRELHAAQLDARLERRADGRASWQFGPAAPRPEPSPLPAIGSLQVGAGQVRLRDEVRAIDVQARLTLADGSALALGVPGPGVRAPGASASAAPESTAPASGAATAFTGSVLQVQMRGRVNGRVLDAEIIATGAMPWATAQSDDKAAAHAVPLPLQLKVRIDRAEFAFDGVALDLLHLRGLSGRFSLNGPSLAAVGDPLNVTLPTTAPFRSSGVVVQRGGVWNVRVDSATVGGSQLHGAFVYDARAALPVLSGRLEGKRLLLADLGPVVGAPVRGDAAAPALSQPASRSASSTTRRSGRVLPDRAFDLPSLRLMNANVLVDIAEVDLNTRYLEPLQPLRAHLVLAGGVLSLSELEARTAQGRLFGQLRLDGRGRQALWDADLRWSGVRLERWLRQARADNAPPYVTGRLSGSATLTGQGRSTAEILASLGGKVRTEVRGGTVSHLVIEAAGLDLAQALGLLISGDDALPVPCAVADLVAEAGVLRPRVMVIDASDSVIWVEGSLSLATEALNLRAIVSPRDFSPLALRSPLRVHGSFAAPEVSIEKGPMGMKLAGAMLLALLNPLAALVPLLDSGDAGDAQRDAAGCAALKQRAPRPQTAR